MPSLHITRESLAEAAAWRLGAGTRDEPAARQLWDGFLSEPRNAYLLEEFAERLGELVRQAVALRLEVAEPDGGWWPDAAFLGALWEANRAAFRAASLGDNEVAMQQSHLSGEKILKAVRWKLGIPSDNDPSAPDYWRQLCSVDDSDAYKCLVARALGSLMEDAVKYKLGVKVTSAAEEQRLLEQLWDNFNKWFLAQPAPNRCSSKIAELLGSEFKRVRLAVNPSRMPAQQARPAAVVARPPSPPPPPKKAADTVDNIPVEILPTDTPIPPPVTPGSAWKYKPLPSADDEPDGHAESQVLTVPLSSGLSVIGARVRGKKHKHEGTHCDDWFEVRHADPWTLIAVSDGAGSYRFSRVGAEVSCQAAIDHLERELSGRILRTRATGLRDLFWRREEGVFEPDDLTHIEKALRGAMPVALDAVRQAALDRADSEAHQKVLKRKLAVDDLSATLLLAACTRVRVKDQDLMYVATCSVGDGMIAGICDDEDPVHLLAEPDSGSHSGETYFLTSRGRLDADKLKFFYALRPMRALMVMTDGVADDYFPPQKEMLRLYADMVVNRVLLSPAGGDAAGTDEARAACETDADVIGPEPGKVRLRSAGVFADRMKRSMKELVASPELLRAASRSDAPDAVTDPAERLRVWLDTYQVRGSFDDRTLVVLHREGSP